MTQHNLKSESPVAGELRNANFAFLQGRPNLDGSTELPTLNDWRDAEKTALRRIAERELREETAKKAST